MGLGVSADTPSVGYPVHAVASFVRVVTPHGVPFVNWTAQCGASDTKQGRPSTAFGRAGSARKAELCVGCFPAKHWNSCRIDQPQDLTPIAPESGTT